jgi:hypothetical protein
MKILCIAHERRAAQAAASALRGISQNFTLTWAQTPGVAAGWLRDHPDAPAVIVDANPSSTALLDQVRSLGAATPILVIAPEPLDRLAAAVKASVVDQQARHDVAVAGSTRICMALQDRLLELEGALRTASERDAAHEEARRHAATELAAVQELYAILDTQLTRDTAARATLEQRLSAADASRRDAEQQHAAQVASLNAHLSEREAQHNAWMARSNRVCETLQQRLQELDAASRSADERHAADLSAAAERAAALEDRLVQEVATRTSLEERLADAQAQYDSATEQAASVGRQLTETVSALQQVRRDWQSDLDAAAEQMTRYETELRTALADAAAVRSAFEQKLADAGAAHQQAEERAAADLTAAADRYAALDDRLVQEVATRTSLEEKLADAEAALQTAEAHHAQERESLTRCLAILEAQCDSTTEQAASVERQLTETISALQRVRCDWQSDVTAAAEQLTRRETELGTALANLAAAAERSAALEDRLNQEVETRTRLEDTLAAADAAHQNAENDHEQERQSLTTRLSDLQAQHDTAVAESSRDIARLHAETDRLRRELTALRTQATSLRREADRVTGLQQQLADSQKKIRRQFERAPYALFECAADGKITRVNHSLVGLLGFRSGTELLRPDVVETIFECPADLHWLLERVELAGKEQSVETRLKAQDGRRLGVRLHALTLEGSVLIAVEDMTQQSALEQQVREAQRMGAVGRVASEVAVTCDALLRDVARGGRVWLAGFESDISLRHQGELLLGDVSRAAGLLRQFAVYGHKQITNLEPVSVLRVLGDMKPVLERVLGDDIALVLPKPTKHPFDVDVESERVERILVNVANYARERMPRGGQVRIKLATTVVDQPFLASHPKVRPGAHVLITISEKHGAIRRPLPMRWPIAHAADEGAAPAAADKPGMDLGPLGALISDLGGHLWMSVEPTGSVTLQIHLPRRTQDDVLEPPAPRSLATRGRRFARWFRH